VRAPHWDSEDTPYGTNGCPTAKERMARGKTRNVEAWPAFISRRLNLPCPGTRACAPPSGAMKTVSTRRPAFRRARPRRAEDDSPSLMLTTAPDRPAGVRAVRALAVERRRRRASVVMVAKSARVRQPKRVSFPSRLPPPAAIWAKPRSAGVVRGTLPNRERLTPAIGEHRHRRPRAPSPGVGRARHASIGPGEARGDGEDG